MAKMPREAMVRGGKIGIRKMPREALSRGRSNGGKIAGPINMAKMTREDKARGGRIGMAKMSREDHARGAKMQPRSVKVMNAYKMHASLQQRIIVDGAFYASAIEAGQLEMFGG